MFVAKRAAQRVLLGSTITRRPPIPSFVWRDISLQQPVRQFCCTGAIAAEIDDDHDHDQDVIPDYFALLGVSRRFLLDPKGLQDSYHKLMAKCHPDMRHNRSNISDNDHEDDEYDASQITHAYDTLRKPHTRATHLLELVGRPMEETADSASLVSPDFLMHVMEWREDIDSIGGDNDADIQELEQLLSQTRKEIETVLIQLDAAFESENLDRALQLSAQLQYWHRIEETIQDKL